MQTTESLLAALDAVLPPSWQEPVTQLTEAVLEPERPLRIVLAGAFTVGKSSLINMLTAGEWLPTALEETTALPTFVEYGASTRMQLVDTDGSARELSLDEFRVTAVQAPPNAAYAVLALDHAWLEGTVIVDLPGLGGMSQSNQQYALAQIQQADAVLYLIPPRGPDASDLATLTRIRSMGKHIALLATRWDEVELAVASGEKKPDLQAWVTQIEQGSGLRTAITPVSKTGTGRETVIDFVRHAHTTLENIRLRRLRAELTPVLENALGQNALMQSVCHSDSEEARQAAYSELLRRKMALTDLKADLHAQASIDRAASETAARELDGRHRSAFESELSRLAASVTEEAQWKDFVDAGTVAQQRALDVLARDMQELSAAYGALNLPDTQQQEFQLRLPPPAPVASQDFLEVGRMAALKLALEEKQVEEARLDSACNQDVIDNQGQRQALQQALAQRHELVAQPLPLIMQPIGNGKGAAIGRILGELADLGTMFINPAAAGAKIAAVVGKGAKVAKIALDTAKVAKVATRSVKVLKATKVGGKVAGVPPAVIDKLGMLEAISFGYWGERIGSAFDGPQAISVVDPEAQAQRQADLHAADAAILALRNDLMGSVRLAQDQKLSGWALEQNRKEQAALQADLDELEESRKLQMQAWQAQQVSERAQLLERYIGQALDHWRRAYSQQADAMMEMLRQLVKHHWEERVDAMVNERLAELAELSAAADATPAEQQAALVALQAEAEGLRTSLRLLAQ